jgi:ribosomal protein L29
MIKREEGMSGPEVNAISEKTSDDLQQTIDELKRELAERTAELDEARAQQVATAKVLQVISRSTSDLQPVLDILVETAGRLCGADLGNLSIRDGEAFRVAATFAVPPDLRGFLRGRLLRPAEGAWPGGLPFWAT